MITINQLTLSTVIKCCIPDCSPKTVTPYCNKEMSLSARLKRASLCVETAIVLPIFLFAMISILYFSAIIQYTNCVEEAIHQTARDLAVKDYVLSKKEVSGGLAGKAGGVALSETYVRSQVNSYLSSIDMKAGSISYLRSDYSSNDCIDIIAEEKINIPYSFLGMKSFHILERARVHGWTGYDSNSHIKNEDNEEIVFITSGGSVYHRNRACSHLKVTPRGVAASDINNQRSKEGSKYYPCEYCRSSKKCNTYYITDYGNRYHTNVNCGAITRDIECIKLSEVAGRRACKDCG